MIPALSVTIGILCDLTQVNLSSTPWRGGEYNSPLSSNTSRSFRSAELSGLHSSGRRYHWHNVVTEVRLERGRQSSSTRPNLCNTSFSWGMRVCTSKGSEARMEPILSIIGASAISRSALRLAWLSYPETPPHLRTAEIHRKAVKPSRT